MLFPTRPTISFFYSAKAGQPVDKIDVEREHKIAKTPIEPHPEAISSESSVRHVFEGRGENNEAEKVGSLKADIDTIKETFALTEVPKESLYIGAAGVLPYAFTSLSTVVSEILLHYHSFKTSSGLYNYTLFRRLCIYFSKIVDTNH